MSDDDDFQPKLGKMRARGKTQGRRYVHQVLRAAALAGGNALSKSAGKRRFDGSRIGRGSGAGRVLRDRHANFRSRRVVIKTRIVKIGARGLKAAALHLRYIQRDGVTREETPGELYDATQDRADGNTFLERADGDRHQFRFIIAAEDSVEYEELKGFTRRFMARMEQDLGTKLDWVAVDHFNTGHPHTHVILRGKDDRGEDLVIARDYIAHGMRERASEIVTLDLGPRTDLEIERKLAEEIDQGRLTSIDRRLIREAGEGDVIDIRKMPASERERFQQTLWVGRLQHLKRLGLVEEASPGLWRLSGGIKTTLQRLGERGDIIKTMHRAMTQARIDRAPADYAIFDPAAPSARLVGRLVERGLSDENNDRHYLIVDGVDGRSHWVDVGVGDAVEQISAGSVVAIAAKQSEPKLADRIVAGVAERHGGRYSAELHRQDDPSATGAYVAAHVRRLEALRRANIVERTADGSWRIPADFIKAVEATERAWSRQAPVSVEILSSVPVPQLIRADAETWLDRQLVAEESSSVRDTGFGREVRGALAQRRQWLIEQGLAEDRQDQIVYRAKLLAILRRRELTRVAVQVSRELGLPYSEAGDAKRIEGTYRRRLDLVSGRFAVIERARDFTLVPWRLVLERSLGKHVSGVAVGDKISWSFARRRTGPVPG